MKNFLLTLSFSALLPWTLTAQTTSVQLPTAEDSASSVRILNNAGITRMQINSDGGLYIGGVWGTGVIPKDGPGARLMWYPRKAAFRAGYVSSSHWDDANIGFQSFATGFNTIASGSSSTALGYYSEATGGYSTVLGYNSTASADYAIAIGYDATASGSSCIAIGHGATSSGGIAMGTNTNSSAGGSIALGNNTTASGFNSMATGASSIASGDQSTAMGTYVKAKHFGSFIIGDRSKSTHDSSSALNEMTMRFNGGYRFFTNSACSTGVYMNSGDGAWSSVCDRNRKENFNPINGEQILEKIKAMPITEWNYKGQDPAIKYMGPVAQDFYSAFHLGGTDSIGISTLSIDGVNIAAIQALEKRTAELQKANEKITAIEKSNSEMQKRIERLEQMITSISANSVKELTSIK